MKEKLMKELFSLSKVFASPKRLLMLEFLRDEPLGYTQLIGKFEGINIPNSTCEIYKSLKILLEHGFVVKDYKRYVITKKGMVALESLKKIINEKPRVPKLRMEF